MDFPELKIVQLHCGFGISPERALSNCIWHPNVYTDISVMFAPWMDLKFCHDLELLKAMEYFIPDKVWYGSDFPVFLPFHKPTVERLRNMPLSVEFKRKLLRENAEKFFLQRDVKK
jgi:predicted TIM-barrel fold metal-dependent hydrolase